MLYPSSIQLGIELRTELYFVIFLYQLGRVVRRIVLPKYHKIDYDSMTLNEIHLVWIFCTGNQHPGSSNPVSVFRRVFFFLQLLICKAYCLKVTDKYNIWMWSSIILMVVFLPNMCCIQNYLTQSTWSYCMLHEYVLSSMWLVCLDLTRM